MAPGASRRLLALAGDRRLVGLVREGSEPAFEVLFERYGAQILAFCRQILGSTEEAEDAVQQTFASAHGGLLGSDNAIDFKPWLFTIARNRSLSMVRARREESVLELEETPAATGVAHQAEQREDLRELVRDLADLPERQRSALVLFELGDLSQEEIADVLGCEERQVKGLVFRARAGLVDRREGREAECTEIREEIATVRRGSLRRSRIQHHLRECPSCAAFRDDVRRQRAQMALLLPVTPSAALKASVLGAVGSTAAGSGTAAKVAVVAVLATTAGGAGIAVKHLDKADPAPAASGEQRSAGPAAPAAAGLVAVARRSARAAASSAAPARHPGGPRSGQALGTGAKAKAAVGRGRRASAGHPDPRGRALGAGHRSSPPGASSNGSHGSHQPPGVGAPLKGLSRRSVPKPAPGRQSRPAHPNAARPR